MKKHLYIWEVSFDYEFRSSSGTEKYTVPHNDVRGVIYTESGTLEHVENSIQNSLDNQSYLISLNYANFIGITLN